MTDEAMWSEFEGLWGIGIEELSDVDDTQEDGVLHRGPNFEDDDNDY